MKSLGYSSLFAVGIAAAIAGCQQDAGGENLLEPRPATWSPDSLAAGVNDTFDHQAQSVGSGVNGITDPTVRLLADQAIGTPDTVARLHGAQKIQYATLGRILGDLGVDLGSTAAGSAAQLYATGQGALGVAIYASRVPELILPSTSALAKEYDIFVAAATEILKSNLASSQRCPGVQITDSSGAFTQDGISCLIGKPAKADYLTLAAQVVSQAPDQTTGQQIAIATLLAAAHTSE